MSSFKDKLYAFFGDVWFSPRSVALWPWPATVCEWPSGTVSWNDYRRFESLVRPGDIIVGTENEYWLTNFAIQGRYKHVGVYAGETLGTYDSKTRFIKPSGDTGSRLWPHTIVHAISEGVVCQDLGDYFFKCDLVAIVRPWKTDLEAQKIVDAAFAQVGKGYDFDFKMSSKPKRFYCSELGAFCIAAAGIKVPPATRVNGSPMGLLFPLKRFQKLAYLADSFVDAYPTVCSSTDPG